MKTLYIVLFALFISLGTAHAQFGSSCLPEGITFTNQSQIDNFQANHPGCMEIEGDVTISDNWHGYITNLNGLSVLNAIGGSLEIFENSQLTNLSGLDNLAYIGGSLSICGNDFLVNITSLGALTSIGGDLSIGIPYLWSGGPVGNAQLTSLSGLDALTEIGGNLNVLENDSLISLTGLNNLNDIGGGVNIYGNPSLTSLTGLEGLTTVPGSICLGIFGDLGMRIGNPMLPNLTGLDNLTSVGGSFAIHATDLLADLTGLQNLNSIGGVLSFMVNPALTSLSGLENLTTVGGLQIGHWWHVGIPLNNLNGLESLTSIEGDLIIQGNSYLTSLTGLDSLVSIGGNLSIGDGGHDTGGNPLLINITGLGSLTSVGGNLTIKYNNSMICLDGMENLAFIGGDLSILNNPVLSNCSALSICDYLSIPNGSVNVYGNSDGCNNPMEIANECGITLQCLPFGNYYFFSQADIDSFSVDYPGCEALEGNVTIKGEDITNLLGLSGLTYLEGNLIFGRGYPSGNPLLIGLEGLESLTTIGGNLEFYKNNILTDMTGLESLSSIGGSLIFYDNNSLNSMAGLDNLTSISGSLKIGGAAQGSNPTLTSLAGLEGLITVGGELQIHDNPHLKSLTGLDNLVTIGADLRIIDNDSLVNLTGLEGLISVGESVIIGEYWEGNLSLLSLAGLENLESIGADLFIEKNPSLASLSALEGLSNLGGSLSIGWNPSLMNLSGLEGITYIDGDLQIVYNDSLTQLTGLDNLASIGGELLVGWNNSLTSLSGLNNVDDGSITNLSIYENPLLTNCEIESICSYLADPNGIVDIYGNAEGCNNPYQVANACGMMLPCLPFGNYNFYTQADIDDFALYSDCSVLDSYVMIQGDDITNLNGLSGVNYIIGGLRIDSNPSLTSIYGLHNLDSIGLRLSLFANNSLQDLAGFEKLKTVGSLLISNNNTLSSLTGLENLTTIRGSITIGSYNSSLKSLQGLENVNAGLITHLTIIYNYLLSDCAVQSICDYLANQTGTITINMNDNGCNSQQEVLDACLVGVPEEIVSRQPAACPEGEARRIVSFPNPTDGIFNVQFTVCNLQRISLKIYDVNGREVAVVVDEKLPAGEHTVSFDASGLPAGVYFYRLAVGGQRLANGKLVKY